MTPVIGCYGIGLDGLPTAREHMSIVPDAVPAYTVSSSLDPQRDLADCLNMHRARLRLSDRASTVDIDRATRRISFSTVRAYSDEQLLHPFFASSAAAIGYWLGRDSFHAGAAVVNGRAWAFLGDKGDGKSTTVAQLARHGHRVVSDDLLVVEGNGVHAGPSFVDLRADAAEHFGDARDLGFVGTRTRARLNVPAAAPWTPLAGWVALRWGARVQLTAIPIDRRIALLYQHRSVRLAPRSAATYVRHAALPSFYLTRPKTWSAVDDVIEAVRRLGELAHP